MVTLNVLDCKIETHTDAQSVSLHGHDFKVARRSEATLRLTCHIDLENKEALKELQSIIGHGSLAVELLRRPQTFAAPPMRSAPMQPFFEGNTPSYAPHDTYKDPINPDVPEASVKGETW